MKFKMVLSPNNNKKIGEIKQNTKNIHECPYCKERFKIGIEKDTLDKLSKGNYFPYPHVHIHGNPLHAMLCYIDKQLVIRNICVINSIEISRNSETFQELMKKWANPF